MLKNLTGASQYCGLDIGSSYIKAGLLDFGLPFEPQVLGVYQSKTFGLKNGVVSDLGEFSESIHSSIGKLSNKTGIKIKSIQLGIGAELISIKESIAEMPLSDRGSKIIVANDLKKINYQAKLLGTKIDEQVIHDLPKYYKVDDVVLGLNPLGLHARKIGVNSLIILSKYNKIKNLIKAVNNAGYDVDNVFLNNYAASEIIIDDQEKKEGCILVDIGAKNTNILIFKDNALKFIEKIEFGSDNFTFGISSKLNLSLDLAEEIKRNYAVALDQDVSHQEDILIKKENNYMPLKRGLIFEAIENDVNFLVKSIVETIKDSGLFNQVGCGVRLVGGGCLMTGLIDRIASALLLNTSVGKLKLMDKKPFKEAPIYSSCVGLAYYGYKLSRKNLLSEKKKVNSVNKILNNIVELYQEYF